MKEKPFTLFYGGAEQPGWQRMLHESGAAMMVSYKGLERRLPKNKPYTLATRFPEGARIFLDSGAHAFNKAKPGTVSQEEIVSYAARYEAFVETNVDAVELVSEFDSRAMGLVWMAKRRAAFYDHLDPKKFMPVWHAEDGEQVLRSLGERYDVVGVTATYHSGRDLTQSLNVVARAGVHLHGIAMTKPEDLRVVDFASAASTSWLSPQQYGDSVGAETLVWGRDENGRTFCEQIGLLWQRGGKFDVRTVGEDGRLTWCSASVWQHKMDPRKRVYRVRMQGGRSVVMSGDHNVFRLTADGGVEHVQTTELRKGDRLMSAPGALGDGHEGLTLNWKGKGQTRSQTIPASELAEFLGLWVGDGHHEHGLVGLSVAHYPDCRRVVEHLAQVIGATTVTRSRGFDMRLYCLPLRRAMQEAGFAGPSSERTIPALVFSWAPEHVAGFLRGLFSADGSCTDHTVTYATRSPVLAQQVALLLEPFDVLATVHSTMSRTPAGRAIEMQQLTISDALSVRAFLDKIGFLQPKIRVVTPRPGGRVGNNSRRYQPANVHGESRWDLVAAVEEVPWRPDLYDLSVPGPERFWANGLIVHNTILWDGQALHRYPRGYKDRSRRQHSQLIVRAGFDIDKIMADDPKEVVRLALWSWQQFEATVSVRKAMGRPPGNPFAAPTTSRDQGLSVTSENVIRGDFAQLDGVETATSSQKNSTSGRSLVASGPAEPLVQRSERRNLPVLGFEPLTSTVVDADGKETQVSELITRSISGSARGCDNCYLNTRCPMMSPGAECAFDIPIEVKTPEQASALRQGLIEMQAKRVAVLQFGEDLNGGMADPNLSTEMDRLWKHMSSKAEIEDDRTSIDVSIRAKGQASTLERIFGREPTPLPGQATPYMDAAGVNREMARVIEGDTL